MSARRAAAALLAALLLAGLAACGKRGSLEPPPDVPVTYPRTYPTS